MFFLLNCVRANWKTFYFVFSVEHPIRDSDTFSGSPARIILLMYMTPPLTFLPRSEIFYRFSRFHPLIDREVFTVFHKVNRFILARGSLAFDIQLRSWIDNLIELCGCAATKTKFQEQNRTYFYQLFPKHLFTIFLSNEWV